MDKCTLTGPKIIPEKATSAVVFLHGYGADGQDLLGLSSALQSAFPNTAFFAPNGPEITAMGYGRQWFSDAGGTFEDLPGLNKATNLLEAYLKKEVYAPYNIAPQNVVLVGFSMSTMTALHAAPRLNGGVAGVVGFSGALMFPQELAALQQKHLMPILLVHGMADAVVPPEATNMAEKMLKSQGYTTQKHLIENLVHGIDLNGIKVLKKFLQEVFK